MTTSGGKTLVAEVLVWQQLLLKKRDALFVLPYVALVQEKASDANSYRYCCSPLHHLRGTSTVEWKKVDNSPVKVMIIMCTSFKLA